jgi:hypothetical protein
MNTNPMQRISDLEAEVAALTAENRSLKALSSNGHSHPQPNPEELANAIGARLMRVEQNLREDFVGKFAATFLLALETITKRVIDAEERQTGIERKLVTHKAEIAKMLEEANQKQFDTLQRFNNAIRRHHEKNEATLQAQQEAVAACDYAARATAHAASLCVNFKKDYEDTAYNAKLAIAGARNEVEHQIGEFTRGLKEKSEAAVTPAIRRLRDLNDSQIEWRVKWSIVGFITCIFITAAVSWIASPSAHVMIDAARWRNWQASNFTQQQADQVNNLLKEIEKENAKKAGEEQRNDPNSPLGTP